MAKALLGNAVSGIAELGLLATGNRVPTAGDAAAVAAGGGLQGIPGGGAGGEGAGGIATAKLADAVANSITGVGQEPIELGITASGKIATATTEVAAESVSITGDVADAGSLVAGGSLAEDTNPIGFIKLGIDLAIFAGGYLFACD